MGTETVPISQKTKDSYSIEISHIYLDHPFSVDQIKSVEQFHDVASTWDKPYSKVVLFDDYNVDSVTTSYKDVLDQLKKIDAFPEYFAFEKDLIQYSQYLIDNIKVPKVKRQYESYISRNNKYPCSLLTSVWYLTRLGYIPDNERIIKTLKNNKNYEPVTKLINFLPAHFSGVEQKSKKLIEASNFSEAANQIQNVFFDSDGVSSDVKKDLV